MVLRNVGILPHYTASQPRRPRLALQVMKDFPHFFEGSSVMTRLRGGDRSSFPGKGWDFSRRHRVLIGSGVNFCSYLIGSGGAFPSRKVTGA
jgi:hypothetical protein